MKLSHLFLIAGIIFSCLLLVMPVSATAFSSWTVYGDAWKATNDTTTLIMYNQTGTHYWLSTGNTTTVRDLIVAGGGGADASIQGAGAGGVIYNASLAVAGTVTIVVGAGGSSGSGGSSSINSVTATGGGGIISATGGSGAGGAIGSTTGGLGIAGQGNNGGNGDGSSPYAAGGGGGAGAVGATFSGTASGNGGDGLPFNFNGTTIYYGGGGGGGATAQGATKGSGGLGGGGNGGATGASAGIAGVNGLGAGGGGSAAVGGAGGSGTVIIEYLTPIPIVYVPVASFTTTASTPSGVYPIYATFTDTSTNSPTTTNFSYGDGLWANGTAHSWTHFYNVAGYYSPRLICNNTNTTGVGDYTETAGIQLTTDFSPNVTSWVHFNGANGWTNITGEAGLAWLSFNGAALSTTQKKFGSASLRLQTNDARISTSADTSLNIGVGNATIEFWIYPTAPQIKPIIKRSTGDAGISDGWGLYNTNGAENGYVFWTGSEAANASSTFTIANNAWSHVAVTFNNTATNRGYNVYINGVLTTSKLSPGPYDVAAAGLMIGSKGAGTDWYGYIDEFRFSNGNSRWMKYPAPFNTPYAEYVGALTIGDTNLDSTIRFKTTPPSEAVIANQTNGGYRTRTLQIQNVTNTKYVVGSTSYDKDHEFILNSWIRTNNTYYPAGLTLISSSVDTTSGLVYFNVSKDGAGFNGGTDRVSFLDMDLLYDKYEDPSIAGHAPQYFGVVHIINATDGLAYPVHHFLPTNITYQDWIFTTDVIASATAAQVGVPVIFHAPWTGAYPNMWNWSLGGMWVNGTTVNSTTYTFTSAGTKDISVYAMMSQNVTNVASATKAAYVTVAGGAEISLVPNPKSINWGIPQNITVQVKNISHTDYILINFTFNQSILQVQDIYPAQVGVLSVSGFNNVAGYAFINLSTMDSSYPTNTPVAYVQFNVTSPTIVNVSEPLNLVQQTGFIVNSTYATPALYMFAVNNSGVIEPTNDVLVQTFNFVRTDTLATLSTIQITNVWDGVTSGTAYTTTGSQTVSSTWGFINLTSTANAFYDSKLYYIEITGGTTTIYMTPFSPDQSSKLNQLYPREVQFSLVNPWGQSLQNVTVTAIMQNSTADNTNWFEKLFGISPSATDVEGTLMTGISDSYGTISFPMISSGLYEMTFTDTTQGISTTKTIHPQQLNYIIVLQTTASLPTPNKELSINGSVFVFTPDPPTIIYLNMSYRDSTLTTQNLSFYVNYPNMTTLYSEQYFKSGTSNQSINTSYGVTNIAGMQYVWGYYANNSIWGNISESNGITLKGVDGVLIDFLTYRGGWKEQ